MTAKSVRYMPDFKRQMVGLVRSGRTPRSLLKEFGPAPWTIALWAKQAARDAEWGLTSAEREELTHLRRESWRLKEEREILSTAGAWFATRSALSKRSFGS